MALNLYNSLNLIFLADQMIDDIKNCWNEPFNAPTVIFPDFFVEDWFKRYWIKNNRSVLMNLRTCRLDSYLFDILKPENQNIKNLSQDMLQLMLIKELSQYRYSEYLDEDLKYIFENGSLSYVKVYDMAKTLAGLFMEYEISCPDWFDSQSNRFCYSFKGWQRELYDKCCKSGITIDGIPYKTLAELFFSGNTSDYKQITSNNNCFIFGFAGIGTLYREILKSLSDHGIANFYLYLQAELIDKNIDDVFSKKLGTFGRKNLEEYTSNNSFPPFTEYPDFELNSAPSKIREVEVLHSDICRIIQTGNAITFEDIKVFAPDIKEYIPAINLVFGAPMIQEEKVQKKRELAHIDDLSFGIPFTINDYSSSTSFMVSAMKILAGISFKQYFSRVDFLSLISNPVIRASYGITDEFLDTWKEWINMMNVFRKRTTDRTRDDWGLAKRRLLLSELTTNETIISVKGKDDKSENQSIKPFSSNCDDSCIFGFVSLIDDLNEWISLTQKEEIKCILSEETSDLDKIKENLKKILSMSWNYDDSISGERTIYRSLMSCIGLYKRVFNGGVINNRCLLFSLLDYASNVSLSQSGVSRGIEFFSFKPNRIIPTKHVFFLGLDSNAFPGAETKNVLDMRKDETNRDSNTEKNNNAFLCQIKATSDSIHMSFVNKNLQKDEDYYRSSVINEVVKIKGKSLIEIRHGIDEKIVSSEENKLIRISDGVYQKADTIKDLYTYRRLRNYRINNLPKRQDVSSKWNKPSIRTAQSLISGNPQSVSVSQLRKYLEEPLRFQAEKAFAYADDNEKDNLEFEPIELDNLTMSIIRKSFLDNSADSDERKIAIEEDLSDSCILPDGEYGIQQVEILNESIGKIIDTITSIRSIELFAKHMGVSLVEFEKYTRNTVADGNSYSWTTSGKFAYYNDDFMSTGSLICVTISNDENATHKDFAVTYSTALSLIARENSNKYYNIGLYVINKAEPSKVSYYKPAPMSFSEATCLLDSIFIDKYEVDSSLPKELHIHSHIDKICNYKYPDVFDTEDKYYYKNGSIISVFEDKKIKGVTSTHSPYLLSYLKKKYVELESFDGTEIIDIIDNKHSTFGRFIDLAETSNYPAITLEGNLEIDYDHSVTFPLVSEKMSYSLSGNVSFINNDYKDSNKLICIDIKTDHDLKSFLNGYVSSLALISDCEDKNEDEEFESSIYVIKPDGKARKKLFHITKQKACSLLVSICDEAFSDAIQKCFPIEAFYDKNLKDNPVYLDLSEFVSGEHGPWNYFKKSKLIDTTEGLGYDIMDFERQWSEKKEVMKELLEPLNPENTTSAEEEW